MVVDSYGQLVSPQGMDDISAATSAQLDPVFAHILNELITKLRGESRQNPTKRFLKSIFGFDFVDSDELHFRVIIRGSPCFGLFKSQQTLDIFLVLPLK